VLHLTFDLYFGFDLLHSRKCSPLSHIYVLLNAEYFFIAKCFSFKPIYADYFLEASYGLAQGLQIFCQRTTTQQFEDRASYVIGLFRDMLHSTKSIHFCKYIIFSLLTMFSRAVVWRPWSGLTPVILLKGVMRVLIKITYCNIHITINSEKARGP